jgi:putative protease
MYDHLSELKEAGIDSIKIEGRMKSLYYTALVTRSYRKALEELEAVGQSGASEQDKGLLDAHREELYKISRREFSTGFFFGPRDADETTSTSYHRQYLFLGTVGKEYGGGRFEIDVKNHISREKPIEFIGPDILYEEDREFRLFDGEGREVDRADHGKACSILPSVKVQPGYILRSKI